MKRRLTSFAAVALLADALALGAAWQAGPGLVLASALAVPRIELLMAPLYDEPVRHDVATGAVRGDLYRPMRPRAALVLLHDREGSRDADVIRVARTVARRDVVVFVPQRGSGDEAAFAAYASTLGFPVHVTTLAALHPADVPAHVLGRATLGVRLLREVNNLIGGPGRSPDTPRAPGRQ
jgi:hypothetical protein